MCFAPAAVTRRCRSPASSSSNRAGSANPATAACILVAPALILNWTSLLLPLQTEAPAWKEAGGEAATSALRVDTHILDGLKLVRLERLCTLEWGVQNTAQRERVWGCIGGVWKPFLSICCSPFPSHPTCVLYCVDFAERLWKGGWAGICLSHRRCCCPAVELCCRQITPVFPRWE